MNQPKDPTRELDITTKRCQFVSQVSSGGWDRCNAPVLDRWKHMINGKPYVFCEKHSRYEGHYTQFQAFKNRSWEFDPYANGKYGTIDIGVDDFEDENFDEEEG